MATKRKFDELGEEYKYKSEFGKNHTLDSDEEDEGVEAEKANRLHENDIEGEEDGISRIDDDEVKITPFNMQEELEEGHFDADGHYQWKKEKEIKDNWLDNIDWVKIKKDSNYKEKYNAAGVPVSDEDSSTDEEEASKAKAFDLSDTYRSILSHMQPRETVKKALQRVGGAKKLSSAERWKRKKAGIVDDSQTNVEKLTGYCNEILTRTGNMNIYEETFEGISSRLENIEKKKTRANPNVAADDLDMYADDFDSKEQKKLTTDQPSTSGSADQADEGPVENELKWEYKLKQEDTEVHGLFSSQEMQKMVEEGKFGTAVFVRKVRNGERESQFYNSARIDFELYD